MVPHLSENEVPYLVVDESTLGEIDETIAMEIGVPIIQKCQIGHVEAPEQSTKHWVFLTSHITPQTPQHITSH